MNENSRPEFVTESYGKINVKNDITDDVKKQEITSSRNGNNTNNSSIMVVIIFFLITILNSVVSFECISAKASQNSWNTVADPVAAEEFATREAKLISYYDNYHFIFLGIAIVCELVAIYSLITKKKLLSILMSLFMILCNGFIIFNCMIL